VCPQCPESADSLLAKYQLQELCTAAKLGVELGQITGTDTAEPQLLLHEYCQDVVFLQGSQLGLACFATGMEAARFMEPGEEANAVQASVLGERYCHP
jgi:hypothetical protein